MFGSIFNDVKIAVEQSKQAEEQAAREQAAREQAARDQAAREQAAMEQSARERADREQAARERAANQKEPLPGTMNDIVFDRNYYKRGRTQQDFSYTVVDQPEAGTGERKTKTDTSTPSPIPDKKIPKSKKPASSFPLLALVGAGIAALVLKD